METKLTVYLETTIPGFLTGRPANDLILAGKQEVTRQWWDRRRGNYRLVSSQFALDEAERGDSKPAFRRLEILAECDLLEVDGEVLALTKGIVETGIIPPKAVIDAAHIATASRHGIDFLLTWNCTHIANAHILRHVEKVVASHGYTLPVICTPDELQPMTP